LLKTPETYSYRDVPHGTDSHAHGVLAGLSGTAWDPHAGVPLAELFKDNLRSIDDSKSLLGRRIAVALRTAVSRVSVNNAGVMRARCLTGYASNPCSNPQQSVLRHVASCHVPCSPVWVVDWQIQG
jgi:hypothetical protein